MSARLCIALLVLAAFAGCPGETAPPTQDKPTNGSSEQKEQDTPVNPGAQWKGYATPEELEKLNKMETTDLKELLKDFDREPALRVEAMRLLVEKTENKKELYPILLTNLRSPTIREREATLYYFSRFGTPNHIVAIEASALGIESCVDYSTLTCNCITYSIECTIKQILERSGEKAQQK
jgi:hypothetical protein